MYLDLDCFRTIEQLLLLRSTKVVDEIKQLDSALLEITDAYVRSEEEGLERNLEKLGYNIDSPNTVLLVTGNGRIDRVSK
jgi:hypothetical protein